MDGNEVMEYEININMMPDEVLMQIFDFLPILDRLRMPLICERWKSVSEMAVNQYNNSVMFSEDMIELNKKNHILFNLFNKESSQWMRLLEEIGWGLHSIEFVNVVGDRVEGILQVIARYCPRLRALNMPCGATSEDITALAHGCQKLETICIMTTASNDELTMLFQANPNITNLKISKWNNSIENCLVALTEGRRRFQQIHLTGGKINTSYLTVLREFEVIRAFAFESYQHGYTPDPQACLLENVSQARESLAYLAIKFYNQTCDNDFAKISRLTGLLVLDIQECHMLKDEHLKAIAANCQRLRAVKLATCSRISDVGMRHVLGLSELRVLSLERNERVTLNEVPLLMPNIMQLQLTLTNVPETGLLRVVRRAPRLQLIELQYCNTIQDSFIEKAALAKISCGYNDTKLTLVMACDFDMESDTEMDWPNVYVLDYKFELQEHRIQFLNVLNKVKNDMFSDIEEKERPLYPYFLSRLYCNETMDSDYQLIDIFG